MIETVSPVVQLDPRNYTFVDKFGHNPDVDTLTVPEDVWDGGGLYPWPAAAAATTIQSDDPVDDGTPAPGGTGARTVLVQGLDTNLALISETVTLNGVAAVALANEYFRVFRAYVVTAGSGGVNAGNITVQHGATVLAQISIGVGQTLMAIYTTPVSIAGVAMPVARLTSYYVEMGRQLNATAEVALIQRDATSSEPAWNTKVDHHINSNGTSAIQRKFSIPLELQPGTDIRWTCNEVSANNTDVSAGFEITLR